MHELADLAPGPARSLRSGVLIAGAAGDGEEIADALRARGFDVALAPLAQLEDRVADERPSVVIVDIDEAGAVEAVERLHRRPPAAQPTVLLVGDPVRSAELEPQMFGQIFERPVDLAELGAHVASAIDPRLVARSTPPPSYPHPGTGRPNRRESEAPQEISDFPGELEPVDVGSLIPASGGDEGMPSRLGAARISPELEQLLAAAEQRVAGSARPSSVPAVDDDVDLMLSNELLAALDEPLDPEDEEGGGTGSSANAATPHQGSAQRLTPGEAAGAADPGGPASLGAQSVGGAWAQASPFGRGHLATPSGGMPAVRREALELATPSRGMPAVRREALDTSASEAQAPAAITPRAGELSQPAFTQPSFTPRTPEPSQPAITARTAELPTSWRSARAPQELAAAPSGPRSADLTWRGVTEPQRTPRRTGPEDREAAPEASPDDERWASGTRNEADARRDEIEDEDRTRGTEARGWEATGVGPGEDPAGRGEPPWQSSRGAPGYAPLVSPPREVRVRSFADTHRDEELPRHLRGPRGEDPDEGPEARGRSSTISDLPMDGGIDPSRPLPEPPAAPSAAQVRSAPGRPRSEPPALRSAPGRPRSEPPSASPARSAPGRPLSEPPSVPARSAPGRPLSEPPAAQARSAPGRPFSEPPGVIPVGRPFSEPPGVIPVGRPFSEPPGVVPVPLPAPAPAPAPWSAGAPARAPEPPPPSETSAAPAITVLAPGDAPRALARAVGGRMSGSFAVTTEAGTRRIVLHEGDLVTAASDVPDETLLAFLALRGDLDRDLAVRLSGRLPASGRHAGAALIAHGYLGQDDLWPVLRAHAEWLIGQVVLVDAGTCELEEEPPGRLKAEPNVFGGATGAEVLADTVRRVIPPEVALRRLGGSAARLDDGARRNLLGECALREEEDELVRAARGRSVGELVEATEPEMATLLYALVCLEVLDVLIPPSVSEAPRAPEHDPLDEEAIRKRVKARLQLVQDGDYFMILGIPRDATSYEIRRAYLTLRRAFEPSRLLTAGTADLLDDVQLVIEVLDEAYDILRDGHRRERYRRAIEAPPP